jgi:H+/Cl- antiporter ClcA
VFWVGAAATGLVSVCFAFAADQALSLFHWMSGQGGWVPLILAGSAAGISAAFNAPLAGIVFAIEEMGRSFEPKTSRLVLSAVLIAGLVSLGLVGNYDYFGQASGHVVGLKGWMMVLVCGVVGGAAGALFGRAMLWSTEAIRGWTSRMPLWRTLAVAGLCGLGVALIGLATGGSTFGTGYESARAAIEGEILPWYFAPAKLVATLLSSISGIPGGIFAPSLAVGTGIGSIFVLVLGGSAGIGALLGMTGYFAGVVQAPITAFVIILEMTGDNADLIPIMGASMLGYGVSNLLMPQSLYHGLAKAWVPKE